MDVVGRPSRGEGRRPGKEEEETDEAGGIAMSGSRDTPDDKATLRFRNDIDCRLDGVKNLAWEMCGRAVRVSACMQPR